MLDDELGDRADVDDRLDTAALKTFSRSPIAALSSSAVIRSFSGRTTTPTLAPTASSSCPRMETRCAGRPPVTHSAMSPRSAFTSRRVDVRYADEVGHEGRLRVLVDLGGRAHLLDDALAHDGDAVAHGERLFLVVGHVDEGDADVALQLLELELHGFAQLGVERAERFVEQQHGGLVDQRPRQGDALLLAARQLARLAPRSSCPSRPSRATRRRAASRRPATRFLRFRPKATFSQTFRCGNSP